MNNWISVNDRLPNVSDRSVIVDFPNGSVETVHVEDYFKDLTNGFDENGNQKFSKGYLSVGITHWMECPESNNKN